MEITLPTIPAGVLTLLAFFAPFAQALVQHREWSPAVKRVLALIVPSVLAAVVLVFYYVMTGDTIPEWPVFILLAILVAQASFALFTKKPAHAIERQSRS